MEFIRSCLQGWVPPDRQGVHDAHGKLLTSFVSLFCNSFSLVFFRFTSLCLQTMTIGLLLSHLPPWRSLLSRPRVLLLPRACPLDLVVMEGGAKRSTMFFVSPVPADCCFGFVGAGARCFCLKSIIGDSGTCGVAKHSVKFSPPTRHFFLRGADSMAYCVPSYPEGIVPREFHEAIRMTAKTIEEWKTLFAGYLELDSDFPVASSPALDHITLKTQKKFWDPVTDFRAVIVPSELEDIIGQEDIVNEHWWEDDDDSSLLPAGLFCFLLLLRVFMNKYDTWLLQPHDIVLGRVGRLEEDIHQLCFHCEGFNSKLGQSVCICGTEFLDVWSAIDFLAGLLAENSEKAPQGRDFLLTMRNC